MRMRVSSGSNRGEEGIQKGTRGEIELAVGRYQRCGEVSRWREASLERSSRTKKVLRA